jgi:uncharacterized ion transporter superfamily protein YfcC
VMELKSYLEDLEVPKPNREVNMTWDPFTTMTNLEDVILCSYEKVQYNTHRIHGAAIYGNIYHQYTPNVSIYIYTIHGSCGIVQKSGILHDHMYRSGRDLPRQSRALRPGRLVMASIVSGVIIYRPHKLMCIYISYTLYIYIYYI